MANTHVRGAVSIFAVVLATLLLTVLTIGFMHLMISAQQRAVNDDLSQSAYDAALAGVEDAKRVVRSCADGDSSACQALEHDSDCKVVARAGVNGSVDDFETRILSNISADGAQFDQAYTCVDITMNSPDVVYDALTGREQVIPLRSTDTIRKIVIEWFTDRDSNGRLAVRPTAAATDILPPLNSFGNAWNADAPPLLRAQLITPGEGFLLSELDMSAKSSTVLLRPSTMSSGGTARDIVVNDGAPARATTDGMYDNTLTTMACSSYFANDGYSCRAVLLLEGDRAISATASKNAVLRLGVIYKSATIRVTLLGDGDSVVYFDGVQPLVDSTGRTNNLFRRVEARLRVESDSPYPSYVADVHNDLCKTFSVYDSGYTVAPGCSP